MMALVDYGGSSSENGSDDEETPVATSAEKPIKIEVKDEVITCDPASQSNYHCENDEVEESLKMRVPGNIKLEDIIKSKPKKKKKGKVLINLPTFSDDSDSDNESRKSNASRANHGPRKGLASLLPAPKAMIVREGNRPMIPYSLSKKPTTSKVKPKTPGDTPSTSNEIAKEKRLEDLKEPKMTSFFSIDDDEEMLEVRPITPPLTKPTQSASAQTTQNEFIPPVVVGPRRPEPEELPNQQPLSISFDHTASMPTDFIPQAELRNQRKRKRDEPINLIDIRQDELTAGVEIELTKGISQEEDEYKKLKSDQLPSRLAASKHQITWLAAKAKEQEFELKNSWATAKFNKMQTRNKYGF